MARRVATVRGESFAAERHLGRPLLESWLDLARPASYLSRLKAQSLTDADLERVAQLYRGQLAGRTVSWTTSVVFLTVVRG